MKSRKNFTAEAEWLEYLRYYYAGMAMQGMATANGFSTDYIYRIAEIAVEQADALIEALKTEK